MSFSILLAPDTSSPYCITLSRRPPRFTLFPYTTLFRSSPVGGVAEGMGKPPGDVLLDALGVLVAAARPVVERDGRSEEHTSELQSLRQLVCRPLLEKKTHGSAHPIRAATRPRQTRRGRR